jgi:hypothetical protein
MDTVFVRHERTEKLMPFLGTSSVEADHREFEIEFFFVEPNVASIINVLIPSIEQTSISG